jgi:hypothetical protein
MEFDEWSHEQFDAWPGRPGLSTPSSMPSFSPPAKFPEVVIGSSSDDDAPPVPQSSQLARENLELRIRVDALVHQAKALEQTNDTLKSQLHKCRTSFASQMKSKFKGLFH